MEGEMAKQTWIATLVVMSVPLALFSSQACAAEGSLVDFPFMVHCVNNGTDRAYYLAKIDADGVAVYISPDNQAGTITLHGPAEPVGGEGAGSCSGKTLQQLSAAGQAFYLEH
jgi:hypothetical protein